MKFSIVTISYNQAEYLEECIQSVLNQSYENIEYIMVDPGSTDGSRDIIERYRDRMSKIIYDPDNGPADGLNKGFLQATGDIYFYLNSDDRIMPDAISKVVEEFKKNPQYDVILGNGLLIDDNGDPYRKIFSSKRWSSKRYAYGAANAIQQSTFFTSKAFQSTEGFNDKNESCWDGELLVDMAIEGANFGYIDEFLGEFRMYPDSISGSGRLLELYMRDQDRIRQKILGESAKYSRGPHRFLYRVVDVFVQPRRYVYNITHRFS